MTRLWAIAAVGAVALVAARPASGQVDYRNLDDDRPTLIEDAYPVERYAFEWISAYALERDAAGGLVHAFVPELEYGIARNAHVGLKLPLALRREGGDTDAGLSGLKAFALYNVNTESPLWPALSLRTDATFPIGSLGGTETRVSIKAIATRSFGRSRVHINAAYALGRDGSLAVKESLPRWWYGAALDRTLFRESVLLVGAVYAVRTTSADPVQLNASVGLRYQWRPTAVVDVGLSRGLRRDLGPEYALTIGITHAFAIAGLLPTLRDVVSEDGDR